jgi:hypothetical protein
MAKREMKIANKTPYAFLVDLRYKLVLVLVNGAQLMKYFILVLFINEYLRSDKMKYSCK